MPLPDSATVRPSSAELWVAYHRKTIISVAAVILAGLNIVRDAAQTADGVNTSTWVIAGLAVAQAVAVYFPGAATAKLIASAVLAIGSGVSAAVTDGISSASLLVVAGQFLAWAAAGVTENGPAPDVARAATDRGIDRGLPE
jgi:hypothetical protein